MHFMNNTISNNNEIYKINSMLTIEQTAERKESAQKIIRRHMLFSAGLGFIPFPILDAAAILGNQVLMVSDLSDLYGIPFKKHRVKSFIGSLVSNLSTIGLVKFVPGLGSLLGGATVSAGAAAATYALGKIFVQHFDQGGTLLNFDPVKSRKYFQELHEEGKVVAENLKQEKEATKSPLITQNLKVKMPFVTKKVAANQAPISKKQPIVKSVAVPQKIEKKVMPNQQAKPIPKKKSGLLNWMKWVFFIILISVLAWVGWKGYKENIGMDKTEEMPNIINEEHQVIETEEMPLPTVLEPEDSTKIGDG